MTSRRQNSGSNRPRRFESLEKREVLNGHSFAAAFLQLAHSASMRAAAASFLAPAVHAVQAAIESHGGTTLSANLSDATTGETATVAYKTYTENGTTETELKVSVKGAAANSTFDVTLGTTVVGQIKTDVNGAGSLKLSSNPDGDETALPAGFPTDVAAGLAVSIGTLTGTLATPTITHAGCSAGQQSSLTASLTDGTASASVKLTTNAKLGTTQLDVSVTGATASSSLDVTVAGVVVGQVATDTTGAGSLTLASSPTDGQTQLPTNFPTGVTSGSTVQVGTLSGAFASASHGHSFRSFRFR